MDSATATETLTEAQQLSEIEIDSLLSALKFPQSVGIEYEVTKLCGVDPIQQILGAYLATSEGRQNYLGEDVNSITAEERVAIRNFIANTIVQLSPNGPIAIIGSQANGFFNPNSPHKFFDPVLHDLDIMCFGKVSTEGWNQLEPKPNWHSTLIPRDESVYHKKITPSDDRGIILISYGGGTSLKLKQQSRKKMQADFNPHILSDICEIGFAVNHQTPNGQEINLTPLHFDPAQKTILVFYENEWYKVDRQPEAFSTEYLKWLSQEVPASLLAKMYLRQIQKAGRAGSITEISDAIVSFREVADRTGLDLSLASAFSFSEYGSMLPEEIDNTYALWSFFQITKGILSYKPNPNELAQFNLQNPNSEIWWLLDNWLPAVATWLHTRINTNPSDFNEVAISTRSILTIIESILIYQTNLGKPRAFDRYGKEALEQLLLPSKNLTVAWNNAQSL